MPLTADQRMPVVVADNITGITVESCRLPGDSLATAWEKAMAKAMTFGVGVVVGTAPEYALTRAIQLDGMRNLVIAGLGKGKTVFTAAAGSGVFDAFSAQKTTAAGGVGVENIVFRDMSFKGGLQGGAAMGDTFIDRATRTFSAAHIETGVRIVSSYAGKYPTYPVSKNLTFQNVSVYGTKELPLFVSGVYGSVTITESDFERTLDVGANFCESVRVVNNHSRMSFDNGFSVSRGNGHVVCANNTTYGSYYAGIMAGGFDGDPGPQNVTITGNVIDRCGEAGIKATGATKRMVIANNVITDVKHGALEDDDLKGHGIIIGGNDTDYCETAIVTGNAITDAAIGGITVFRTTRFALISDNLIVRAGRAVGTTGANVSENLRKAYGIGHPGPYSENGATISNVLCQGNYIVDDRTKTVSGTTMPVTLYDVLSAGISGWENRGNVQVGVKNGLAAEESRVTRAYIGSSTTAASPRVSLDKSGSGYDSIIDFFTAGNPRFALRQRGINTFVIQGYKDDGTATDIVSVNRSTNQASFIAGVDIAGSLAVATGIALGSSTGSEVRFTLDSAGSGAAKIVEFKTAGLSRATVRLDTAFRFTVSNDSNVSTDAIVISRAKGNASFANPPQNPALAGTALTNSTAALYGAGAHAYNTTTSKPVWSDGTAWRYADGTAI